MTAAREDKRERLSANAMMAEYANLAALHDVLGVLVGFKVISQDDRIKLTRKFMDDRPQFKEAVQAAMNAGLQQGTRE